MVLALPLRWPSLEFGGYCSNHSKSMNHWRYESIPISPKCKGMVPLGALCVLFTTTNYDKRALLCFVAVEWSCYLCGNCHSASDGARETNTPNDIFVHCLIISLHP